jgi:hypothetical protein
MSAEEFVAAVEDEGVELELGERLATEEEGKEIYGLELVPLPRADGSAEDTHEHGGGSLTVYDDVDGAEDGYEQCERAADLLCYRAANIVVIVGGGPIEAQRLAAAVANLEED